MSNWTVDEYEKIPKLNKPILIEGLPGIGNVGKVVVDFLIDQLKAKKLYEFHSYTFPHSVFVNEDNLVELPRIELYYKKFASKDGKKKQDVLLLAGDVQPIDEVSCYEFCDKVLDIAVGFGCKEIITLGGIGLQDVPKKPKVYCTGNSEKIINKFVKGTTMTNEIYGVVGPIIGVSGLLIGLAERRGMEGVAMLAETFGHPMYLGIKGAREILKIIEKKLTLGVKIKKLDEEIESIEKEVMKTTEELSKVSKDTAIKKLQEKFGGDVNYIG